VEAKIHFTGHWGWQWYAKQNGMIQLEALNPEVRAGDYLVYPENIHQQTLKYIGKNYLLKEIDEYYDSPSVFTFFSTRDYARFYASTSRQLPWIITWRPIDPIKVYRLSKHIKEN